MKYGLLVCFIVVGFATPAAAIADWTFGVKGGVSVATLHGDASGLIDLPEADVTVTSDLKDSKTGFAGGIFANIKPWTVVSVQVEALYIQKGGKGTSTVVSNSTQFINADVTLSLDYIEFPALLIATFPAGPLSVSGFGGVSVAFNTKADVEVVVGGSGQTYDAGSVFKGSDTSGIFGLGIAFGAGSLNVVAEGRYEYSLDTVADVGSTDLRNGALVFTVGATVPMGL